MINQRVVYLTYCLTALLDEGAIHAAVEQLSVEERERHDRFVFARDRRDFAVAHALLRRSLSAQGNRAPHEWTFATGARGKPTLALEDGSRTPLVFNLAHTDGLVACAVSRDVDLGIDVEAIDRRLNAKELATRFFAPAEAAALEQCPDAESHTRFVEIWTLKEAFVKALGEGLSCPLDAFTFTFVGPSSLRFDAEPLLRSAAWSFALFAPSDRHRMALAVGSPSPQHTRLDVRADPPEDHPRSDATVALRISVSADMDTLSP
jgi:4'-phosphopantetheinyl transferase